MFVRENCTLKQNNRTVMEIRLGTCSLLWTSGCRDCRIKLGPQKRVRMGNNAKPWSSPNGTAPSPGPGSAPTCLCCHHCHLSMLVYRPCLMDLNTGELVASRWCKVSSITGSWFHKALWLSQAQDTPCGRGPHKSARVLGHNGPSAARGFSNSKVPQPI